MQSSYKSKFIILSVFLMFIPSLIDVFSRKGTKIGSVEITNHTRLAYVKKYKDQSEALNNFIADALLKSKYIDSELQVPKNLIIKHARQDKSTNLSNQDKMIIHENKIIKDQIIKAVTNSVIITNDMATAYAKGLLQLRSGKKTIVNYDQIKMDFSEEILKKHYAKNKNLFISNRVVRASMLIIDENKVSKDNLQSLIANGASIHELKDKYEGQIEGISWINRSMRHNKYTFLNSEQKSKEHFYSASDGNIIYVKVVEIIPSKQKSYEESEPQIQTNLRKEFAINNIMQVTKNAKWENIPNQTLNRKGNADNIVLFLTNKDEMNYYVDGNKLTIIHTNEVQDIEPTLEQISRSKSALTKYFASLTYRNFMQSVGLSYQDSLHTFFNNARNR
ncbi:hypothetical protein [Candidatus Cytomitobacter primus]|uniref:Uncharacterized protein n=1 Tax=Candidatus Cytomitobacter primus TaxID=2066024 RepID=A0A5C0UEC0_9PROT|nr:hypothetical protein [Candidatus Cytomitobacter primus]QEK38388.1 hypothetical protein FZC34_00435 [Candidatus Cytomitobacter primus]